MISQPGTLVRVVTFGIVVAISSHLLAAPPKVDTLFPAGMQRGSEATITATGDFKTWPVQIAVSQPGLTWKAAEKKGQFEVTATADATPGVYWVRFYTDEGASAPRPFQIGQLPDVSSKEPNDETDAPQQVKLPAVVNGKLEKSGDVDGYAVDLKKGEQLVASLAAHRPFNSPMDGVIQICDEAGFVLFQNDDARGFDPQLAFKAPASARYLVRLFAFPATPNSTIALAGGASFIYRLTLTTGPFITHTLPAFVQQGETTKLQLAGWNLQGIAPLPVTPQDGESSVAVNTGEASNTVTVPVTRHRCYILAPVEEGSAKLNIELPATVTGQLTGQGEHRICFAGKKGENLRCDVEARALHSPLDAVLELFAGDAKLQTYDDANKKPDPQFSRKLTADGEHTVVIRDLHDRSGDAYFYRMTIDRAPADFQLTVAASEFIIPKDKPLEIPVNITRTGGLRDEIAITARGLPEGVTCDTVTSAASGDTAKKVTLRLQASTAVNAAFTITGVIEGKPELTRRADFTLTDFDTNIHQLWISAAAKQ